MKDKRKQQDEIIAFGNLRQYALETGSPLNTKKLKFTVPKIASKFLVNKYSPNKRRNIFTNIPCRLLHASIFAFLHNAFEILRKY